MSCSKILLSVATLFVVNCQSAQKKENDLFKAIKNGKPKNVQRCIFNGMILQQVETEKALEGLRKEIWKQCQPEIDEAVGCTAENRARHAAKEHCDRIEDGMKELIETSRQLKETFKLTQFPPQLIESILLYAHEGIDLWKGAILRIDPLPHGD